MLSVLPQEYERGLGGWQAEWETLPEIFRLTAGALARTEELLQGLEVHPDAMARNLDATHGLIFAEAVMMALAAHVGKPEAHRITEAASQRALASGKHFRDVLLADQTITTYLKPEQIHQLFNPLSYTGVASQFMDRVLAESALALKASGS
jgi:3-carboxy-cis,cis-muconate cycloisomerase